MGEVPTNGFLIHMAIIKYENIHFDYLRPRECARPAALRASSATVSARCVARTPRTTMTSVTRPRPGRCDCRCARYVSCPHHHNHTSSSCCLATTIRYCASFCSLFCCCFMYAVLSLDCYYLRSMVQYPSVFFLLNIIYFCLRFLHREIV